MAQSRDSGGRFTAGGGGSSGEAYVEVRPDFTDFGSKYKRGMTSAVNKVGRSLKGIAKGIGAGLAATVSTALVSSIKLAVDVDSGLRRVNSLFGLMGKEAEKSFGKLQQGVKDLSSEIGVAQSELTDGLYQAISAGVPRDNAFTFMKTAAKAGIAGVTDTNTAVEGLSKVINAFGIDFADAETVADSMFMTVNKGIVTFEELSGHIYQAAPAAAAAGVSMTEMNAALTALTLQGIPMAESATRVQSVLTSMARKAGDLRPIFQKLGFESASAAVKQKGLKFALDAIYKAAGGSQEKLLGYLGRVEAVQAVNVLAGKKAGTFTQALKDQANATGASGKAFEEIEKSAARKFEKAGVAMKNVLIEIGNVLLPIVTKGLEKSMAMWKKYGPTIVNAVKKIVKAIKPFFDFLGDLKDKATEVFGSMVDKFKSTMGDFSKPIEQFKEYFNGIWSAVQEAIDKIWPVVKKLFNRVAEFMGRIITRVARVVGALYERFGPFIKWLIAKVLPKVIQIVGFILRVVMSAIEKIAPVAEKIIGVIASVVETVIRIILRVINAVIRSINFVIRAVNLVKPGSDIKTIGTIDVNALFGKQPGNAQGSAGAGANRKAENMGTFHSGGTVPGPPSMERLAIVRGGEYIDKDGKSGRGGPMKISGRLSIDDSGVAFIRGIAEDVVDSDNDHKGSHRRMKGA